MGQDTRCHIGVTYHCTYIPENRELIEKLIKMNDMYVYLTNPDSDEVFEINSSISSADDKFDTEQLAQHAEDWYGHKNINIIGGQVIFKRNVYEAHVRNISRRKSGLPIYDTCYTASGMIQTLQQVIEEFKVLGIEETDLYVGHIFTDD